MQTPKQSNTADQILNESTLIKTLTGVADSEIVFDDFGWDSRAYIIDGGKIVFKFPRSERIKKLYPNEIAGLKLAASLKTQIQIPSVHWTTPDSSYMGYKGIVGVGLHTIIEQLAKAKKIQLGTYIGSFLKNFHSQQLEGIPIFTVASEIALLQEKYQLSRPIIASSVPASDVIKLDTYIKSTLSQELHFLGSKTVLSHGDLGLWNMLYTNDGNLGFIDFEDIGYYDESKDFTGLTDPLMLNSALRAYGSDSPELRQKIIARSKITTINDVSFFKDKDNAKALKFTIDKIMQFIA